MDQNCYEIINACFFQDQKITYQKLYQYSVIEVKNISKLFLISNNFKVIQISFKNESQNFFIEINEKDLNSSIEKDKKEFVINSNNKEDPQNNSKSTLIPNNSQETQIKFLLCEKKNNENESLQNFFIEIKEKDLDSSRKKKKI